jgi:hypothetical protein
MCYSVSKKENARRTCSGLATFHCSTVFAGNSSASLTAIGQDTFFFPASVRLIVAWLNPMVFDICSCVSKSCPQIKNRHHSCFGMMPVIWPMRAGSVAMVSLGP